MVRNGIANFSLRPLAAELDTSPRILIFHFKSKEGLLQDVLVELHSRIIASFETMAREPDPRHPAMLERFWNWAASEKNLPYLRLLYEAQIVAIQNPAEYGRYLKNVSTDWQSIALASLSGPQRSSAMATLCVAVFDGLFLELMTSGDRQRLKRALNAFIRMANAATGPF